MTQTMKQNIYALAIRPDYIPLWLAAFNKNEVMEDEWTEPLMAETTQSIACISVTGPLFPGMYKHIGFAFQQALNDDGVMAIAFLFDSPGGIVSGFMDLSHEIYHARGRKPIWAILDDGAYSAAYGLACACDFITVPETGGVGSIGAVNMHVDITKSLDMAGLKITTVQYGERKTELYPTSPLTEQAEARMQAEIDFIGEKFVDLVARNRGLSVEDVKKTQALTYLGPEGVKKGLADQIASPKEAMAALMKLINT